ncbi:MAG: right-handed parallel beta-helix repeat-containing protein [Clostridia bacterium]|nr:right-handed parallel beta-helix repeat-containing protein [Clostridia bacterium]
MKDHTERNNTITGIYISVVGSDENGDGSFDKPFRSVQAAQAEVRRIIREESFTGDIPVYFRGGTYYIRDSIVIGNDDWSESVQVIYTAYANEDVRLVGGVPVTGWKNEGGGIFSAELPDSLGFWVMYADGVRLTPAREANWQSVEVRDPSHLQAAAGGPSSWFGEILKVTELSGGEIKTMYPKCAWSGPIQYLQGAREYISEPGEWAIEGNRVYYMPADPDTLGSSEIVAGTSGNIFHICGRPDAPVKNITISGLRLEMNAFGENLAAHARANNVTAEYDENLTGLVCLRNAENVTVEHCRMSNGGYMGVVLREYAQHNTIHCNEIRNTGYAGMFLIGENPGSLNYCSKYNVISGNRIFHVGEFVGHGAGIYLMNSGENRIIHNEISDVPRYGISMKGIRYGVFGDNGITVDFDDHWKYNQTTGNYIGYNRIYNTGIRSGDGGGIEGWGIGRDNHIDHNIIYNAYRGVPTTGWRGHSIFLDDAAHYVKVTCNIIYDENAVAVNAGIFIKSIGNYVVNNVFDVGYAKNGAADIAPYICPAGGSVFSRNIVYSDTRGDLHDDGTLTESDSGDRVMLYFTDSANSSGTSCYVSLDKMNHNLYYNRSGRAYIRTENDLLSLDEWKNCPRNRMGYDAGSISADPLFADAQNRDYRLREGSPALALGIVSIDAGTVGLPEDYRFRTDT